MPKEKFESLDKTQDKQPKEKIPAKEPVFATEEELAEKQQLLQALKQVEKDMSLEGLTKQKEILIKMDKLDERRKERMANEIGEEIYDAEKGIFTNIRFRPGIDRRTGTSYISRHVGRPLVVLLGAPGPEGEIVPNKPYKAIVVRFASKGIMYVRIIE